jgi:predicted RNA methylase
MSVGYCSKEILGSSKNSVYSFHKTSTRQYISQKAKQWNVEMKVLGEIRFLIPQIYKMHKKKSVDVEVDFVRFYHQWII